VTGRMALMKPRERVLAALRGEEFDRYPAIAPTSVAVRECMDSARSVFPPAHVDAGEMALLAAAGHDILGFDSVMPYFSVHLESSALGCEIDWGDKRRMPSVLKRAIERPDDFSRPSNLLEKKEFSALLRAIEILKKKYGDSVAIIGKVMGPWTLAYNLYGAANLILDSILAPERTKRFIAELAEIPIAFARAQFEAGADLVTWADHVTADLISPQIYAEFVLPSHKKAAVSLRGFGGVILHVCGNVEDRLHLIKETGFQLFHIDSRNDIDKSLQICGSSIALTGFVNNPVTLAQGTPSEVKRETERIIAAGVRFAAPECAVPYNVSQSNLKAVVEAAHGCALR